MQAPIKVWIAGHPYVSFARVAEDLRRLLGGLGVLVEQPSAADVVLINQPPTDYVGLLRDVPALARKYVIGFAVWEADALPDCYKPGVEIVDEIWTASGYCESVFGRAHPRVTRIPHLCTRAAVARTADVDTIRSWLGDRRCFNYLNINHWGDRRKNVPALLEAFREVHLQQPDTRLVIKTFSESRAGQPLSVIREGPVLTIDGFLPEGMIDALYGECQAYVSAHCSEGWGLTLSDAMLVGKPVVATGYSGNMEFMAPENSFLVDYREERIRPESLFGYFRGDMRWAYPDHESLVEQMLLVRQLDIAGQLGPKLARAKADLKAFDAEHLSERLSQRLSAIAAGLAQGELRPNDRRALY